MTAASTNTLPAPQTTRSGEREMQRLASLLIAAGVGPLARGEIICAAIDYGHERAIGAIDDVMARIAAKLETA